jgi:hypothetical protein
MPLSHASAIRTAARAQPQEKEQQHERPRSYQHRKKAHSTHWHKSATVTHAAQPPQTHDATPTTDIPHTLHRKAQSLDAVYHIERNTHRTTEEHRNRNRYPNQTHNPKACGISTTT